MTPKQLYENAIAEVWLMNHHWEMQVCHHCEGSGFVLINIDCSYDGKGTSSIGKVIEAKHHCEICGGMGRNWFSTEKSRLPVLNIPYPMGDFALQFPECLPKLQ